MKYFDFGGDKKLADKLKELVLSGKKTATTGFYYDGKKLDKVGDQVEIVDSDSKPFCVVEYTKIEVKPFMEVDFDYAQKEGEGDKDIEEWRENHRKFYQREYAGFTDDSKVICCEFKVIDKYE